MDKVLTALIGACGVTIAFVGAAHLDIRIHFGAFVGLLPFVHHLLAGVAFSAATARDNRAAWN